MRRASSSAVDGVRLPAASCVCVRSASSSRSPMNLRATSSAAIAVVGLPAAACVCVRSLSSSLRACVIACDALKAPIVSNLVWSCGSGVAHGLRIFLGLYYRDSYRGEQRVFSGKNAAAGGGGAETGGRVASPMAVSEADTGFRGR